MKKIDKINVITQGAFGENSYIVTYDKDKCVLVDPGLNGEALLKHIGDNNLELTLTILTHNHFDHIAGLNNEILSRKVYMSEKDKNDLLDIKYTTLMYNAYGYQLIENEKDFKTFFKMLIENKSNIITVKDKDTILDLFTVMETPGHTVGSICLINKPAEIIFTGDTLFNNGYGRYDLPGGNYDTLIASLKKITSLPSSYTVKPGHGNDTTIDKEKHNYD